MRRWLGGALVLTMLAAPAALLPATAFGASNSSLLQSALAGPGNQKRGAELILHYGCGTCHTIPGIPNARGEVGPPLNRISRRTFIAGMLPNTRQNMMLWLMYPQKIIPGNAMPDMGLTEQQAADITAYLSKLR